MSSCENCGEPTKSKIGICFRPPCVKEYHRKYKCLYVYNIPYEPRRFCTNCKHPLRTDNTGTYCTRTSDCLRMHLHSDEILVRRIVQVTKSRASKEDIPFDLTKDDIPPIPDICPVLGIPVKFNEGIRGWDSLSLDRIVPELGYIKGNVQWMSMLANSMKLHATPAQLVNFARWVLDTYESEAA